MLPCFQITIYEKFPYNLSQFGTLPTRFYVSEN
jgi:hypothetical protein